MVADATTIPATKTTTADKAAVKNAKTKYASANDVRAVVVQMPEAFLRCRDLGHNWTQYRVKRIREGFQRSLWCRSCKTNKFMLISRKGDILSTAYQYNLGYQLKGIGRIVAEGKSVLRLEALDRVMADGEFNLGDPNLLETEL